MSDIAIKVENLSKQYKIGIHRHDTLRDAIVDALPWFSQNSKTSSSPDSWQEPEDTIWALRDVSFEVKRGEVVGIIGRNGAGKTTLLKVLSRITEPTSGRAIINGRVGSLLEVGTGFHPELTGRENIYLNGAILGMRRDEIDRKFDEIVAFSEIEKFLDTPVKRYSSGMYVRLAFAVAAHLEPEILLVDEVLAVGDAAFQKKCLGKMGDVAQEGRTVFFVSHNMIAVSQLCEEVIILNNGIISSKGNPIDTIATYLNSLEKNLGSSILHQANRTGSGEIIFKSVRCETENDSSVSNLISGQKVRFIIDYETRKTKPVKVTEVSIVIRKFHDKEIANLSTIYYNGFPYINGESERGQFICEIPRLPLRTGKYAIDLFCSVNNSTSDWIQNAFYFNVEDGDFYNTGKSTDFYKGVVFIDHSWK